MLTPTLTTVLDGLVVAFSLALLPLLARQKLTYFRPVRGFLVLGYLFIVAWAVLDFANLLTGTEASGLLYTLAGVPAILVSTLPLTLASVIISKPKGHLSAHQPTGAPNAPLRPNFPLFAFTALVLAAVLSLWLVTPFTLQLLPLEFGGSIFRPSFAGWYVGAITLAATAFVLYPCRLMIVRSRTIGTKTEARAMLPECDPTQPCERAVKDYIDEASSGLAVVIVPSASPLRTALKGKQNVMLFVLNGGTAYPAPGDSENEFMIPHEDTGLILES